jgi:hypothetical protein
MAQVAVNVSRPNYISRLIARVAKAFEVRGYAEPEATILLLNDVELAKRGLDRDNLVALATRGLY